MGTSLRPFEKLRVLNTSSGQERFPLHWKIIVGKHDRSSCEAVPHRRKRCSVGACPEPYGSGLVSDEKTSNAKTIKRQAPTKGLSFGLFWLILKR